jgi:CBS domain-containing protein
MANANIGSLLIVKDGQIEGILTERDLLRHWRRLSDQQFRSSPISSIMSQPVFSMKMSELANAPKEMVERRIRHVPLTSDGGEVLGIISMRDVLQAQMRTKSLPKLKVPTSTVTTVINTIEKVASVASAIIPKKAPTASIMHVRTPHAQLVEICNQSLPDNWLLRVWNDMNALQNAPDVKNDTYRQRAAFVLDLDGYIKEDWKKLIRSFIEFLRTDKQPEVFLIWSPHLVSEADVASLQTVVTKARWRAYHRPLPITAFTADIRDLGAGDDAEEE